MRASARSLSGVAACLARRWIIFTHISICSVDVCFGHLGTHGVTDRGFRQGWRVAILAAILNCDDFEAVRVTGMP